MKSLFPRDFFKRKIKRMSPQEKARVVFEKRAREQFVRLKRIGLGISVMSL